MYYRSVYITWLRATFKEEMEGGRRAFMANADAINLQEFRQAGMEGRLDFCWSLYVMRFMGAILRPTLASWAQRYYRAVGIFGWSYGGPGWLRAYCRLFYYLVTGLNMASTSSPDRDMDWRCSGPSKLTLANLASIWRP
jgi:hypothetical protein